VIVGRGQGLFSERTEELGQPEPSLLAAFVSRNLFRESLWIARNLYPDDNRLRQLDHGELDAETFLDPRGRAAIGNR